MTTTSLCCRWARNRARDKPVCGQWHTPACRAAEDARNAMVAFGLAGIGTSVNGLQPSHQRVAAQCFTTRHLEDPGDVMPGWLRLPGLRPESTSARRRMGSRGLGWKPAAWRDGFAVFSAPRCPTGWLPRLAITSEIRYLRHTRAVREAKRAARRRQSCSIATDPRHPFRRRAGELRAAGTSGTKRWPDVQFPGGNAVASPLLARGRWATTALASPVFEEAFMRL